MRAAPVLDAIHVQAKRALKEFGEADYLLDDQSASMWNIW